MVQWTYSHQVWTQLRTICLMIMFQSEFIVIKTLSMESSLKLRKKRWEFLVACSHHLHFAIQFSNGNSFTRHWKEKWKLEIILEKYKINKWRRKSRFWKASLTRRYLFIQHENILDHELVVFPPSDLNPHISTAVHRSLKKSEHDGAWKQWNKNISMLCWWRCHNGKPEIDETLRFWSFKVTLTWILSNENCEKWSRFNINWCIVMRQQLSRDDEWWE